MKRREIMRRITGGVLAALLFLSMGLPAMCGACRGAAGEVDCAEQHGAAGDRHSASAVMDAGPCDSCGAENVSTVNRQRAAGDGSHVLAACGRVSCGEAAEPRGVTRWMIRAGVDRRPPAEAGNTRAVAVHFVASDQNTFSYRKTFTEHSTYQPLTVSLKI